MIVSSKKICLATILLLGILAANAIADGTLLNRLVEKDKNWFRIHMGNGRLLLNIARLGQYQQRKHGAGIQESLQIQLENGQPTFTYKQTARDKKLTIELKRSDDSALIRCLPRGKSKATAVEYRQTPKNKIVLTVGTGDQKQVFRAADLWRLFIEHPEACRQHLFPLLGLLRPDWKLDEMTTAVESSLLKIIRENTLADQARWSALVEQLGDERFAKREAADRELRAGGVAALHFLQQIDFQQLDAEQHLRVGRIIAAIDQQNEDDVPEDVAASLARDPAVWLSLLERPNPTTRRTAAKQLAALLDEEISIDPAAPPDTQKEKREQLRRQIENSDKVEKSDS